MYVTYLMYKKILQMYLKSWSHIEIHLFGLVKPYFFRSNQFILSALSSQAHQIRTSPGADFFPSTF